MDTLPEVTTALAYLLLICTFAAGLGWLAFALYAHSEGQFKRTLEEMKRAPVVSLDQAKREMQERMERRA